MVKSTFDDEDDLLAVEIHAVPEYFDGVGAFLGTGGLETHLRKVEPK